MAWDDDDNNGRDREIPDRIGKKQGWSSGGTLHATKGDSVSLQANFEVENGKAGYYTVQFNVEPPVDSASVSPNASGLFVAAAILRWSVEGQTVERAVSVANGVSISGTGQAMKVTVTDLTDPATIPAGGTAGLPYNVSIQVAPGTRPDVGRPPIVYENLFVVTVGTPQNVKIQPFIGAISVLCPFDVNSGTITSITIAELTPAGTTLLKVQINLGDAASLEWIPIVAGATILQITAQGSAGGKADVTVLWGIDG